MGLLLGSGLQAANTGLWPWTRAKLACCRRCQEARKKGFPARARLPKCVPLLRPMGGGGLPQSCHGALLTVVWNFRPSLASKITPWAPMGFIMQFGTFLYSFHIFVLFEPRVSNTSRNGQEVIGTLQKSWSEADVSVTDFRTTF